MDNSEGGSGVQDVHEQCSETLWHLVIWNLQNLVSWKHLRKCFINEKCCKPEADDFFFLSVYYFYLFKVQILTYMKDRELKHVHRMLHHT